jgi:hypothetical protein
MSLEIQFGKLPEDPYWAWVEEKSIIFPAMMTATTATTTTTTSTTTATTGMENVTHDTALGSSFLVRYGTFMKKNIDVKE